MKKIFPLIIVFISIYSFSYTQNQVGINTNNPDPSAALDVVSNNKGFLVPRMDSTARMNIVSPANGLQVFDTTFEQLFVCNGGVWSEMTGLWKLNGDSIYYNSGNVGIGTASPQSHLHIHYNNPRFQMTNGNDRSIIIDFDESDDDIVFHSEFGNVYTKLFSITNQARVGVGDLNPDATLHVYSDTPSFKITNNNSRSIIIDFDESDDDIIFSGEIGTSNKKLFSVTQEGNFGIGSHSADTTLHLNDYSPFIKFTNSNDFSFLLGLKDSDNSFSLNNPSLAFDFISASSSGDLSISGLTPVSINPGIISPILSLYNPTTSDTVDIAVDTTGALTIPSTSLADRANFLRLNLANNDSLYLGTSHFLSFTGSNLTNLATNYTTTLFPTEDVAVNSDGFYSLNLGLVFQQVDTSTINPTVKVDLKVNGLLVEANYFGIWNHRFDLKTFNKVYRLNENDIISIEISVYQHNGLSTHDVILISNGSYLELIKISN